MDIQPGRPYRKVLHHEGLNEGPGKGGKGGSVFIELHLLIFSQKTWGPGRELFRHAVV